MAALPKAIELGRKLRYIYINIYIDQTLSSFLQILNLYLFILFGLLEVRDTWNYGPDHSLLRLFMTIWLLFFDLQSILSKK